MMIFKKKLKAPPRPLFEIYDDLDTMKRGKEARKLHRELKQHSDGLFLYQRYPYFPLILSLVAAAVSVAAVVSMFI